MIHGIESLVLQSGLAVVAAEAHVTSRPGISVMNWSPNGRVISLFLSLAVWVCLSCAHPYSDSQTWYSSNISPSFLAFWAGLGSSLGVWLNLLWHSP